ncbi:MAG: CDP-alcohol phosphatidyltransferase family protein [Lachnospiraceae bacterium]|nr:CDP-alcohol phosphatidyltransferase family protein [Lachnospiraceae bacterium]
MIGYYNYTVILTYLSVVSGTLGIIVCLSGIGHPFIGMFFLMLSGLCDTFDGRVARTKKDRTAAQISFGIQIDSLADLISFGVLPPCIGIAMLRISPKYSDVPHILHQQVGEPRIIYPVFLIGIGILYVLAAVIRLAYFNVLEEHGSSGEKQVRKYFTGLPTTSAALIFPTVLLIQYVTKSELAIIYFGVMLITAFLFVSRIRVPKPNLKMVFVLLGIGTVEFILLLIIRFFLKR